MFSSAARLIRRTRQCIERGWVGNIDLFGMSPLGVGGDVNYTVEGVPVFGLEMFGMSNYDDPPKSQQNQNDGDPEKDDPEKDDPVSTNATTIAPPVPWYLVLGQTTISVSARVLGVFFGMLTLQGDTRQDRVYQPPPKDLPGFPGATRVKPTAGRARWRLPNGEIGEWDSQPIVNGEKYRYGLIQEGNNFLYITSGVGTVTPPVRFFCRPEIVVFTF